MTLERETMERDARAQETFERRELDSAGGLMVGVMLMQNACAP